MNTEADIRVMQLQTKKCQNHQKPEETRKSQTDRGFANTSDCRLLAAGIDSESLLFQASQFVVLCQSHPNHLIHFLENLYTITVPKGYHIKNGVIQ